jgi:hypothetical protein
MKKDHFRALFSKFQPLCKVYTKKDPPATKEAKRSAWNELVNEFIKIEFPETVDLANLFMRMPNPYVEAKLQVFKGKMCAVALPGTTVDVQG